jgi:hypothetical protein
VLLLLLPLVTSVLLVPVMAEVSSMGLPLHCHILQDYTIIFISIALQTRFKTELWGGGNQEN